MNEFTLLLLFLIMQSSEAKNGLSKESLLRAVKLLHAAKESGILSENVLIYIKINDRKIPYKKVFIISFHKNRK